MTKASCRVYFITHEDGMLTGLLLRTFGNAFLDKPLPSAYGADEESVFAALEREVALIENDHHDDMGRYMWKEQLETRSVRVDVAPLTAAHSRHVIGSRRIPMRISYAYSRIEGGGYRIVVPRLDAQLVLEDLAISEDVLRAFLTNALLGENPRSLFDLRAQGPEYVRDWTPSGLRRRQRTRHTVDDDDETLRQVADELVSSARRGKLGRVVGGMQQLDLIAEHNQLVAPSIVLVGPPGVGKSAWVRALAHRLTIQAEGPDTHERKLWSTSAERIFSGLPYLGEWQERCLKLVRELSHSGDVLYVDRISNIVQPQSDGSSIADFLDAAIADGSISVIAEASEEELIIARRRSAGFVSRLRVIRLNEPSDGEAIELLHAYADRLNCPRLHPSSYRRVLRHLKVFARDAALPGKGIRFFDWLARTRPAARDTVLYPRDVSRAYAEWSGIPYVLLADDEPRGPAQFASELSAGVIGQKHACEVAGRVLARLKSAMTDPARPSATLLFVGPTGVGKTELAKQLARAAFGSDRRLIRFDMSEFMYPGSAMRLIAVGQGVRSLVTQVREEPRALVLFDEIEKAHPQVLDLLLGALDEGRLTDITGRAADLRGTILVMTSNLGVRDRAAVGFGGDSEQLSLGAVRAHFRPELWNRIDYVVPFRALDFSDVERIVRLELDNIAQRQGFVRRKLTLRASEAAVRRIAELGYEPLYGARPLKRVVEERVIAPIAARMAAEPELRAITFSVRVTDEPTASHEVVV